MADLNERTGDVFSNNDRSGPVRLVDLTLLAALVFFVAMSVIPALRRPGAVAEDAAMLLRYSQHLAAHQGIRWNIGEHPVEGATDFLYMAAVAGVARLLHMDAVQACRILLAGCSLLLPLVIFVCGRVTLGANRWLAFALALYVASSPTAGYIGTGFGAPFMMLAVALTWWVGLSILSGRKEPGWGLSLVFSFLALGMALTRPEGNVLAVLMLLAIVFIRGARTSVRLILAFAAIFVVLGGSYFLWRIHYYGYLLPNPFYVKGGGRLHLQGLGNAAENVVKITWPAIPLALTAFRNPYRTRLLLALLIPVTGFTAIWILLSNENNALARFQMPVLPVVMLFMPLLVRDQFAEMRLPIAGLAWRARMGLQSAAAVYVIAACYCLHRVLFSPGAPNSAEDFAKHLNLYANRGYAMAVTEAGTFPYYSGWTSIDILGLNDAEVAHHGLSEAYLDRYKPELLLYHLYRPLTVGGWLREEEAEITRRNFDAMTILHAYALRNHYILAAAYGGEPCSLHVFYVRPGTPDTAAIVEYLRQTPYYFLDNGILSADYRSGMRPECNLPALMD